jgi:AcrR family transcriptional regulator
MGSQRMMSSEQDPRIQRTHTLGKSDRTKLKCIEASIEILSEGGMDELSFEEIAVRAGLSRQLVKNYFPVKSDLVHEAALRVRKQFQEFVIRRMLKQTESEAVLEEYITSSLKWPREYRKEAKFWMVYFHLCATSPKFRKTNSNLVALGHDRITALLSEVHAPGSFSQKDLMFMAKMIQIQVTGGIVSILTENSPFGLAELDAAIVESCRAIGKFGNKGTGKITSEV